MNVSVYFLKTIENAKGTNFYHFYTLCRRGKSLGMPNAISVNKCITLDGVFCTPNHMVLANKADFILPNCKRIRWFCSEFQFASN